MITASPSIRALIPRVSDIAHLHRGACSTLAQRNLCCCSCCRSTQEERQGGGYKGLEKRWRSLDYCGGWVEGGGDKMRTERCKEIKGMR